MEFLTRRCRLNSPSSTIPNLVTLGNYRVWDNHCLSPSLTLPSCFNKIMMSLKTLWIGSCAVFMSLVFLYCHLLCICCLPETPLIGKNVYPRTLTWLREVRVKWPASQTNLALIPRLYKKDSGSLVGEGNVDLIAYLIQSFIL